MAEQSASVPKHRNIDREYTLSKQRLVQQGTKSQSDYVGNVLDQLYAVSTCRREGGIVASLATGKKCLSSIYSDPERFDQSLRLFRRVVVEQETATLTEPELERVWNEGFFRVGRQATDVVD